MNKYLRFKPFIKFMISSILVYTVIATAADIGYTQCKLDSLAKDAETPKVD